MEEFTNMEGYTSDQLRRRREQLKRRAKYTNEPTYRNPEKPYIGTILPPTLDVYIAEYKKTRDPAYSRLVMSLLSKLILKMIHQGVRKYTLLKGMQLQELYHEAFICLHRAMLTFDVSKSSIYSFPRYLQGYIMRELEKEARVRGRMICCGVDAASFETNDGRASHSADLMKRRLMIKMAVEDKMKELVETGEVRQADMDMFKMKVVEGMSMEAIVEATGMTIDTADHRIRRVLGKLQHSLRRLRSSLK